MGRFMGSGDELEHVAFLALWLSYFVFPSRYYDVYEAILPISVHLSIGIRIALAPAVLAHLYADLRLLKYHTRAFRESTFVVKTDMTALFKLVQVWTWERFRELQPRKTNPLLKGEPRLALWHELKQRTSYARRILDNSRIDSFEWRPYTKTLKNWELPQFYPEKGMWVPVGPNLDNEFISFARCIKVSELVGLVSVEQYFPNRVASQFGMLQDVPCPVNRKNLSQEAAWNEYTKPIDDLTFYIPSRSATPRVSPLFYEFWRKSYPEFQYSSEENRVVESAGTSTAINIVGDDDTSFVPFGSKRSRTSGVGIKVAEDSTNKRRKCMKRASDKIRNYTKLVREDNENTSDNNEDDDQSFVPSGSKMNRTSEDGMKIAKHPTKKRWQSMKRTRDKRHKYMKQARDKIRKYMKRVCENDESTMGLWKTQILSENNEEDDSLTIAQIVKKYSDVKNSRDASEPLGNKSRLEAIDIVTSPPETRQYCDDELDVYGSNVEKMTMIDDGSKEPECFLLEDGAIAGEKESSESLIQKKLAIDEPALKADSNESSPRRKLTSGGTNGDETTRKSTVLSPYDQSNIHIPVGDGTMKSNEQLEDLGKRNDAFGEGDADNASNIKRFHELKVWASSIEEVFNKAMAWLIERRAMKERKTAAARLI